MNLLKNLLSRLKERLIEKFALKQLLKPGVIIMLEGIREKLAGRKTYVVAIGAIVAVIVSWVTGTVETKEAVKAIIEAILAVTIRAGVAGSKI